MHQDRVPPRPKETGPWELGRREAWVRGGVPHPAGQGRWPELHQSRLPCSAHKLPKWMTPSPPPPFEMAQSHEQHEVPAGPACDTPPAFSACSASGGRCREALPHSGPCPTATPGTLTPTDPDSKRTVQGRRERRKARQNPQPTGVPKMPPEDRKAADQCPPPDRGSCQQSCCP